jgi:hypothetical protein
VAVVVVHVGTAQPQHLVALAVAVMETPQIQMPDPLESMDLAVVVVQDLALVETVGRVSSI